MAEALDRALTMRLEERRARHAAMLDVLTTNTLDRWRDRFTADLASRRVHLLIRHRDLLYNSARRPPEFCTSFAVAQRNLVQNGTSSPAILYKLR